MHEYYWGGQNGSSNGNDDDDDDEGLPKDRYSVDRRQLDDTSALDQISFRSQPPGGDVFWDEPESDEFQRSYY